MTLITEALHRLQASNFLKVSGCSQFQSFFENTGERFKNYLTLMNYTFEGLRKDGKNVKITGKFHCRVYEIQGG